MYSKVNVTALLTVSLLKNEEPGIIVSFAFCLLKMIYIKLQISVAYILQISLRTFSPFSGLKNIVYLL